MTKAKQYFREACERCEEHSEDSECEVKENCPVYKLFKLKTTPKSRSTSSWQEPPALRSEMI